MAKKDILKTMDTASYCSLIAASALILLFEFTGVYFAIRAGVILYGAAFLIFIVLNITKIVFLKKNITENEVVLVDNSNSNLAWIIVRLCFATIAFVFTVVLSVLL